MAYFADYFSSLIFDYAARLRCRAMRYCMMPYSCRFAATPYLRHFRLHDFRHIFDRQRHATP
jgi:hypothetical protein